MRQEKLLLRLFPANMLMKPRESMKSLEITLLMLLMLKRSTMDIKMF
jgi:hypothetical protein